MDVRERGMGEVSSLVTSSSIEESRPQCCSGVKSWFCMNDLYKVVLLGLFSLKVTSRICNDCST